MCLFIENICRYFAFNALGCCLVYLVFEVFYVKPRRDRQKADDEERGSSESGASGTSATGLDSAPRVVQVQATTVPNRQYAQNITRGGSVVDEPSHPSEGAAASTAKTLKTSEDVVYHGVGLPTTAAAGSAQNGSGPRSITAGTRV